jgi:hypothetical protein
MQGRDLVTTIQTMVLPEEEVLAIFFKKEDFERKDEQVFSDEEEYLISDEDWRSAVHMIGKELDSIYEQCHEIISDALHRVYLSKENA